MNSPFSRPRPVSSGVPQGGALSPVLFSVYTHDLLKLLEAGGIEFSASADDLKIYRSVSDDVGVTTTGGYR